MPLNSITITLDRPSKVYRLGEQITGLLVIENKYELRHEGIHLALEGLVDIHFNLMKTSFLETFYDKSSRSMEILNHLLELTKGGCLMPGKTDISFQLPVGGQDARQSNLYETYKGVFISIQYCVKCYVRRPILTRDLVKSVEFFIEYDADPIGAPVLVEHPVSFEITPDSLSSNRRDTIPNFKITGRLDSSVWHLTEPLTGEFTIEHCASIIKSVDLQLVRIEGSGTETDKEYSRESTEVQNIQIGDGNLLRKTPIPIYVIFPKLFTCPTLITNRFRIGE